MDYDFQILEEALRIPTASYKPVKRCSFCLSVFIDDKLCESCGRSQLYHPIGDPFGPKSFYGIKERYVESLNLLIRFFPFFENKKNPMAQSYVRKCEKRFADLISAFNSLDLIQNKQRQLFYVECREIINELLIYDVLLTDLQSILIENDSSLVGQELLLYTEENAKFLNPQDPWQKLFLEYRFWGLLRVEYCLKVFIITTTILIMAVKYKDIISSQFGK
ncbi:MAG: hypothetical protein Q7U04_06285 [Bacteriovorax sp.]|nr:hypothetical protein [Bacteriovorax sp.]